MNSLWQKFAVNKGLLYDDDEVCLSVQVNY